MSGNLDYHLNLSSEKPRVYLILHEPSLRGYIGGSKNPVIRRWRNRRSKFKCGKHHSLFLQRIWDKHDESEFR